MNTTIISLSILNLNGFDDKDKIMNFFEEQDWVDVVTVNVIDRNIMISGIDICRECIVESLEELGYKVV